MLVWPRFLGTKLAACVEAQTPVASKASLKWMVILLEAQTESRASQAYDDLPVAMQTRAFGDLGCGSVKQIK